MQTFKYMNQHTIKSVHQPLQPVVPTILDYSPLGSSTLFLSNNESNIDPVKNIASKYFQNVFCLQSKYVSLIFPSNTFIK